MIEWRNLELMDMPEWPRIAQWCVLGLLFLLLQIGGYYFYLKPKGAELKRYQQQTMLLEKQVETMNKKVIELPHFQAQLHSIQQQLQTQQPAFPLKQDLASVLVAINQISSAHSLILEKMEWGERKTSEGDLHRLPLNIELQGEYHAIGRFIAEVNALPRLVRFEEMTWNRVDESSEQIVMQAQAVTYQFQPITVPDDD